MTVNEDYFDAELRHAVAVQRFTAGEVKRILALLAKADVDLTRQLRKHLRGIAGMPIDIRSARMKEMIKDIAALRRVLIRKLSADTTGSMHSFAKAEAAIEHNIILSALPIEITLAGVEAATLRAAVSSQPFSGGANAARTLSQWFADLEQVDQKRLVGAIQMGLVQGESIDTIARRVAGTRSAGWQDGVLAVTRRNAEAIVRTAVNHVSNAAREAVFDANAELFDGLRWTSTLDGRTTKICISRDGKVAPVGGKPIPSNSPALVPSTARPPAHVQCRSLVVAIFSANGVAMLAGERPFVRDTRRGRGRRRDFRAEAKRKAGERWSRMSRSQRDASARAIRLSWAERTVGRVPAATTYGEWIKKQPWAFQVEALGAARAKLLRDGGLSVDAFVDVRGNELTLVELAKLHPEAFRRAGV